MNGYPASSIEGTTVSCRLVSELRKALGSATRIALGPGSGRGALSVGFEVDGGRHWIVGPRPHSFQA